MAYIILFLLYFISLVILIVIEFHLLERPFTLRDLLFVPRFGSYPYDSEAEIEWIYLCKWLPVLNIICASLVLIYHLYHIVSIPIWKLCDSVEFKERNPKKSEIDFYN